MSNINNAIVLSLVSLVIILLFINYSEKFTNMVTRRKQLTSVDGNGYITEDISNKEIEEVIPNELQEEVEELVDQILDGINRDYNKKLIRVTIERLEKTIVEADIARYQVYVFVLNYKKESNAKLLLDFTVDKNYVVHVNMVKVIGARQSIITSRGGVSARDQLNIKKPVDMNNVHANVEMPLDYSRFNVEETTNKMVDRNSWILHKQREALGNVKTFPARKVYDEWDKFGVKYVDKMTDESPGGLNYGNRNFTLVPHFMKNNFEVCIGDYSWLFDKSEDVESRPIGVG